MKIFIGTDHAGFELKQTLLSYLKKEFDCSVEDMGAYELNKNDDYPDFIAQVAEAVAKDPKAKGIILGGSGQGEAIVANRFPGIRAVVYYGGSLDIVRLSREHNDANILSLGARFISPEEVKVAVKLWLETEFSGEERHMRRIKKIDVAQDEFDRWSMIKKETHKNERPVYFRERDIFYMQVGKNVGIENNGKGKKFLRPVMILKKFNKHMFLGIPLTTQIQDNAWFQEHFIMEDKQNAAIISQIRVWDGKRLVYKMGVVDQDSFQRIQKAIRKLFQVS